MMMVMLSTVHLSFTFGLSCVFEIVGIFFHRRNRALSEFNLVLIADYDCDFHLSANLFLICSKLPSGLLLLFSHFLQEINS